MAVFGAITFQNGRSVEQHYMAMLTPRLCGQILSRLNGTGARTPRIPNYGKQDSGLLYSPLAI